MKFKPFETTLAQGVEAYTPELVGGEKIELTDVWNAGTRFNRLITLQGYNSLIQLTGKAGACGFVYYFSRETNCFFLYAIVSDGIYLVDIASGTTTLVYNAATDFPTGLQSSEDWSYVVDFESVLVTAPGFGIIKLSGYTATMTDSSQVLGSSNISARYAIVAFGHAIYANIFDSSPDPTRIVWSNLNDFTNLKPGISSTADDFSLESSDLEITGISYSRGVVLLYTKNSIWLMKFNPASATFEFEPLLTGLGNIFHRSVVRNREVDFFIGEDNFYKLDGFQVSPIGDSIWNDFVTKLGSFSNSSVIKGFLDVNRQEVYWKFTDYLGVVTNVVFNFREEKWSFRENQGVVDYLRLPTNFSFHHPLDYYNTGTLADSIWNTRTTDGSWQYAESTACEAWLLYTVSGSLADICIVRAMKTSSGFLETHDLYVDSQIHVKQFDKLFAQLVKVGAPTVQLYISSRHTMSDPIVWQGPYALSSELSGDLMFMLASKVTDRLVRFKLAWSNTATNYVKELYSILLTYNPTIDDGQQ